MGGAVKGGRGGGVEWVDEGGNCRGRGRGRGEQDEG